ncbi:unnamed protein product, partial [Sphacelaria rigidula]
MGIGVSIQFRACLGGACSDFGRVPNSDGGASAERVDDDLETSKEREGSPRDGGATKIVTSVTAFYHRAMARTVVVAGYSTGGVSFFDGGSGEALGSAGGNRAVLAIARSGQSIAYSDGEDVRFASVAKLEAIPGRVCRGGWGANVDTGTLITALAFDALSPGKLYAGSEAGDVLGFNSRVQEADGSYTCLPAYQLPPPHPKDGGKETCNALSTVRGYLLVSHGARMSVF